MRIVLGYYDCLKGRSVRVAPSDLRVEEDRCSFVPFQAAGEEERAHETYRTYGPIERRLGCAARDIEDCGI